MPNFGGLVLRCIEEPILPVQSDILRCAQAQLRYWVDDRFEAFLDPALRAALEAVSQGEAEERLWPLVEQLPDSVFS